MNWDIKQLAQITGGRCFGEAFFRGPAKGFHVDSRKVGEGMVFVADARRGNKAKAFLGDVLKQGAAGAIVKEADEHLALAQLVVESPLAAFQQIGRAHRESFEGTVLGITGSYGKTSTKEALALILGEKVHATHVNQNALLGVPLTLCGVRPGVHDFAVIEAGTDRPGEMQQQAECLAQDITVITSIDTVHLECFGSLEAIAREKLQFVRKNPKKGPVFLPQKVFEGFDMADIKERVFVLAQKGAAVEQEEARVVRFEKEGRAVRIWMPGAEAVEIALPHATEGVQGNFVLAAAVGLFLGVEADAISERLSGWKAIGLRGEMREEEGRTLYVDCYNAHPASVLDSIGHFQGVSLPQRRRLYVLGGIAERGETGEQVHRELGEAIALREGDEAIVIAKAGDAQAYAAGLRARGAEGVWIPENREEAAKRIKAFEGDVFVKGSRCYELEKLLD